MQRNVILHIGLPKTGTTSLQQFLSESSAFLKGANLFFVHDVNGSPNFKSLLYLTVSKKRRHLMPFKQRKFPGFLARLFLKRRVPRHLAQAMGDQPAMTPFISTELLSNLRDREEFAALRSLFPAGTAFTVILTLRSRDGYVASLNRQLQSQGLAPLSLGTAAGPAGRDDWLLDHQGLLKSLRHITNDVRIVDYDAAMLSEGNVIGAVLRAAGIQKAPRGGSDLFLNRKPRLQEKIATEAA